MCSVHATISNDLQYRCQWPGGAPRPSLAFPSISNGSVTAGVLNLTLAPSEDLDWKTMVCRGQHPLLESSCNVTARTARYSYTRTHASKQEYLNSETFFKANISAHKHFVTLILFAPQIFQQVNILPRKNLATLTFCHGEHGHVEI